jgi:hypothetical protein
VSIIVGFFVSLTGGGQITSQRFVFGFSICWDMKKSQRRRLRSNRRTSQSLTAAPENHLTDDEATSPRSLCRETDSFGLQERSDKLYDFPRRSASLPSDPSIPDKSNTWHFPTTCTSGQPADPGQPEQPADPGSSGQQSLGFMATPFCEEKSTTSSAHFHDCARSRCTRREGDAQLPLIGHVHRPKQLR